MGDSDQINLLKFTTHLLMAVSRKVGMSDDEIQNIMEACKLK
jgi:hypothetical protein